MATQSFKLVKFFIDKLILREMKLNRISSVYFFNRKPSKPEVVIPEELEDLDDIDKSKEEVIEKDPIDTTSIINECEIDPTILHEVISHYDSLYFTWVQDVDRITISWS